MLGGGNRRWEGGKWGLGGREVGAKGEGSGGYGGGKWGLFTPCPPPHICNENKITTRMRFSHDVAPWLLVTG